MFIMLDKIGIHYIEKYTSYIYIYMYIAKYVVSLHQSFNVFRPEVKSFMKQ